MSDNLDKEARRRVNEAAQLISSAYRLGFSDARFLHSAVCTAVAIGAEQYAEDMKDDYEREARA